MTLIEISEKIRDHLIQQGRVASNSNTTTGTSMCRYRAENGDTCAVGCLIKPELYSEKLERNAAHVQVVKDAVCESLGVEWTEKMAFVLSEWQFYHDTYFGPHLDGRNDYRSPDHQHNQIVLALKEDTPVA